ncbi:translocation/assembly module TamB domain-containing protein [Yoonia sp. SS1-5]|uniref:Translocation/assembly module TamB domain-containing protein n=1 Tax=Yoonia rhodophyticola TaxID=3137370 RepID=A0AAN0MA48_9RHOB
MRHFFGIIILVLLPVLAVAQPQEEEDKGYIASLIEDNLSGVSREVNIIGFAGALSSEATIDVLTVADEDGVWLTLEDIVLSWNRSALLRGAIDIKEISAGRIVVARAPIAEDTGPSPEAAPFSLPELPVSISLETLEVAEIVLGETFLGEEVALSLKGTAALSGGEGSANVVAERLGGKRGIFEVDGSYVNETKVLGLALNLEEGADGIAARILDLPGRPAIGLQIEGTAPLDQYQATLAIATDGTDRLNGEFALTSDDAGRQVRLDIGGDISPLFDPAYGAFFGNNARLFAQAQLTDDGRVDVSDLDLTSQRLNLAGAVKIGAQGWPELIELTGGISADGDPVLLPLSGPETYVTGVGLAINYDAAVSDDWRAEIDIAEFERPGLAIDVLSLEGGGILRPGEGDATGFVTARLNYGARGLQLADAGAAEALGDTVSGMFAAERTEGEPTRISSLTLSGAGIDIAADAVIEGPGAGLRTQANASLQVAAIDRFSTLIGQELGGGADLALRATLTPLEGLFDIVLDGQTNDLRVGISQADAVLAGRGTIAARAVRDAEGTRLEMLRIRTNAAEINAEADLTSDGSDANFAARLNNVGLLVQGLDGPASAVGNVLAAPDGVIDFTLTGNGPAVTLVANGTVNPAETGQTMNANVVADVSDLTRYATIAQRPLSGSAMLEIGGVVLTDGLRFDLDVAAQTTDIVTGITRLDPFLRGEGEISAAIARPTSDTYLLSDMSVVTPALRATGDAAVRLDGPTSGNLDLQIADAGLIDPSLSGPINAMVQARPADGSDIAITLAADGLGADIDLDAVVARPSNEISGDLTASLADLSAYRALIGQPVSGSVDATLSGSAQADLSAFDARVSLQSQNLGIGNPTVDVLLRGTGRVNTSLALQDDVLSVSTLEVSTPQFSIVGALNGAGGTGTGRFNASLRDVGLLTDQISGPVRARGSASLNDNGSWGVDANGTGPGGLNAQIRGQVGQGGRLDLDIDGSAPLALANKAIEPRRLSGTANFDLNVNGPPAISSLGGRVTFTEGRLAAPTLSQALTDIGGQITLGGNRADVNLRANVEAGGGVTIVGPVGLLPPNTADITTTLRDVRLRDPELYSSSIGGTITLRGPLQNGARVVGRLELGQTDIRVPSSSVSTLGDLPDVIHIGQSAAVQQTLQRAGLNGQGKPAADASRGPGPSFPLDIVIDAPSRIFVRGRGLDAELGGRLSIGGTSRNVIPVGRFDLLRGRIDILQQRFELTEGNASLQGDFEPFIRLVATTESSTGTTINIIVEGPASEPEVRFESTPELPQDEVLSQLIFGRDLDSISPLQAVQLASAVATLAGRGGGAVDRLRRNIGLDDFDVTTNEEGETALRAGKYLSENVYTDVTVTSEGGTEINLNLDITDEITAKGTVDNEGDTSIGVFFERDY